MGRYIALFATVLPCLSASAAANLLIRDATVIDPATASRKSHQDVLIVGDRIQQISKAGQIRTRRGVQIVQGSGRFLIPGLWDAHVHLRDLQEPNFGLLIANGITSVRDMGGNIHQLKNWVRRINSGTLIGPRVKFCGPMLEAPDGAAGPDHWPIAGPVQARAAALKIKAQGAQCIKMRSVKDLKTYLALGVAARQTGLPLFGHPPFQFDPEVAAPAGQRTYEHAFYPYPFNSLPAARKKRIVATYLKQRVMLTPTLVAWVPSEQPDTQREADFNSLSPDAAAARYISPKLKANWAEGLTFMKGRGTPGWAKANHQAAADVHYMYAAGVPLLAGTDLGAPFVEPETALYRELELLVGYGGFTPAQALKAATVTPARLFELQKIMGTVAPGKVADLVLLDADPLADIHNIRSVNTVIARGIVYGPEARERLKAQARSGTRRLYDAAAAKELKQ